MVALCVIKEDFCKMLPEFHKSGRLSGEVNATFLALIPEVLNSVELRDYGPFSLVGCLYRLLSKILANRLKIVLPSIISPSQVEFVHNKQILDGVLIVNELIDFRTRLKQAGVVFKIDTEQAYNHVEWSFVLYMVRRFGFRVNVVGGLANAYLRHLSLFWLMALLLGCSRRLGALGKGIPFSLSCLLWWQRR